jgi:hypothetical protein
MAEVSTLFSSNLGLNKATLFVLPTLGINLDKFPEFRSSFLRSSS